MLSTPAFNALLKTMEEPPPRVVFIMATTERHKVPDTILSRCQQFEFRTIATAKILERLRLIAEAEKITIPDDALREIARAGEGSMRDAQSAFDQVISFAGAEIKKEDVEMALGVAGRRILIRVINGIAEHQAGRGARRRGRCGDARPRPAKLLPRPAGPLSRSAGHQSFRQRGAAGVGDLRTRRAETPGGLFSEADLVRFFHSLAETETLLKTAAHPRYQIEVGLVKLMEMRRLETLGQLLDRLSALEASVRTGSAVLGTSPRAKTVSPSSTSAAFDVQSFRATRFLRFVCRGWSKLPGSELGQSPRILRRLRPVLTARQLNPTRDASPKRPHN